MMLTIIHLFNFISVIIGFSLIILIEYVKRRIKKGPLGDFYALYSHQYISSVEFGIFFLIISFLISSFPQLEKILTFDLLSHFLMALAMLIFVLSGKIFLQEVERMLRHREKEKELLEKYVQKNQS